MSLSILNNVSSLQAQQALSNTTNSLNTSLQRLSTGLQINSGADNPSGYVISQQQQAQIVGINTAISNTNQAVSVVQTGEGALQEVSSLLNQIRGVALSAANSGANDSTSLQADQAQINNALATINTIAQTTTINGKNLLDGSAAITGTADSVNAAGAANIQAGSNAAAGAYVVDITNAGTGGTVTGAASNTDSLTNSGTLTLTGGGLTSGLTVSLDAGDNVNTAATKIQNALNADTAGGGGAGTFAVSVANGEITINSNILGSSAVQVTADSAATAGVTGFSASGTTGTQGSALTATVAYNGGTAVAATVSAGPGGLNNQISYGGADGLNLALNVANGTTAATGDTSTVTVANNALVFQTGANANQTSSVAISNIQTNALGTGVTGLNNVNTTSLADINVTTQAGAQDAIQVVDSAISQVAALNGTLGAFQSNTLQANVSNLQNALTNTTAAESGIADTDFSSEIATFTNLQTQLQAGATVLGNANQTPQIIDKLLQGS